MRPLCRVVPLLSARTAAKTIRYALRVEPLVDSWGREIKSVRVSVTDKCNFRCTYCMPAEGSSGSGATRCSASRRSHDSWRSWPARRGRGAPDRRRAARPAGPAGARRHARAERRSRRSLADDERRAARSPRGPARRGGAAAGERLPRLLDHVRFAKLTRRDALDQVLRGLEEAEPTPSSARSRSTASRSRASPRTRCRGWPGSRAGSRTSFGSSSSCPRRRPGLAGRPGADRKRDPRSSWRRSTARSSSSRRSHRPRRAASGSPTAKESSVSSTPSRAVLLDVRPDPPHGRRPAPHLPLLAPGVGPEDAPGGRVRPTTS